MSSSNDPTEQGSQKPPQDERPSATFARIYREAAPYLALGVQLAATVVIMFYVGYWADDHFGTRPWLTVTGVALGAVAGFYNFFKTVFDLGKKEEHQQKP